MLASAPISCRLPTLNPEDPHLLCAILRGFRIALSSFRLSNFLLSNFRLSSLRLSSLLLIRDVCTQIALIHRPGT